MRECFNELIRLWVSWSALVFAWLQHPVFLARVRSYHWRQERLRGRLGIVSETPIKDFEATRTAIDAVRVSKAGAVEALTSGSTRAPKRLVYTRGRILSGKWAFVVGFVRAVAFAGVRRKSLYVFAPLARDGSLTSLLVEEKGTPFFVSCLQAPYRVQGHPAFRTLCERYGEAAARWWLLTVANPGWLYATNPSTLAVFFEGLPRAWPDLQRLVRDVVAGRMPELRWLHDRISSAGARARLSAIADAQAPLALPELLPGLEAFACWDGGYVKPFLDRARAALPFAKHLPMYSMSTEVIETVTSVAGGALAFLPMAPGVLYEFLPAGVEDVSSQLLQPHQLVAGERYTMVVSDGYGLTRYQTEDEFRCERLVSGVPDLRFVGRRGLAYSFTGEKLTAAHLAEAFEAARQALPAVGEGFLTCFPRMGREREPPHYVVAFVPPPGRSCPVDSAELCAVVERALQGLNPEYRDKRASGRLGALAFTALELDELARRVGGASADGQFKLLPLYPRLLEPMWPAAVS